MSKTSWEYQKEKNYKQLKMMFNLDDPQDAILYHYLQGFKPNRTRFIKRVLYEEMVRWCDHE